MVAKRLDAPMSADAPAHGWKHEHRRRESVAVTGWRPAAPPARRPALLLVGRVTPEGLLRPAGAVEVGLSDDERQLPRSAHRALPRDPPRRAPRPTRQLARRRLPRPLDRPLGDPLMRA